MTEANAVQAAAYALAPIEQMIPAASLALNGAVFLRFYGGKQYTVYCGAQTPIVVTYADRDANNMLSIGDVVDVPSVDCSGLRRKLTLTVTQLSSTLDHLAGRLEVDIQTSSGMQILGAFDASLTLKQPDFTWRVANAVVAVTEAGTTQTVRITSSEMTYTPTAYAFSVTGGSVDSERLGGSYTFATTTALTGDRRRLPSAGELLLTASAGSRARVTPPATPGNVEETVAYAVAATSAGAFAPTQQTLWTAIIRGGLFGWAPNVAPTLSNLLIHPPIPSPGNQLAVSYLAQDANGDPLETTFEWRRNGTVVGTGTFLNAAIARNDVISVTVTVSDGRLSATATTSITIGNPPPQLTLTLTPPQPNSSVDLVAVPNVYEPDGDSVTLAYEWRRNASVIPNRTTATLPASETSGGDEISVRVTASDGNSTVEATASVTITNAPPRVSLSSLPSTVAHGAPVTFTASVADPDGDPVDQYDFVLAYGPAGMTVDPDTGVVSWTASGPMFDRTMKVSFGIAVDAASVELGTGTIEVTDASRDYPLLRFGMQVPTWPAGLSVADHDSDGDTEMLILGQRWLFELESDGAGAYRQSWAYPYALHVESQYSVTSMRNSMVTGDVDGDGRHEIFTSVGTTLTKLDGVDRRIAATRQLSTGEVCADLHYVDLDDDGAADLICLATTDYWTATGRILVLRPGDLSTRHEFPQANYGRSLAIGNVDTDPALEIVGAAGYVFDGLSFANEWLYGPGFGMDVDTGDLDGNGVEEIVAAKDWDAFTAFDAVARSPLWEVPRFDLDSLLVADVAGDARPEVIVGDGQTGHLTIYRYNTATHTVEVVDELGWDASGVTSIGVGDVDSDGERELIWGSGVSSSGADVLIVASLNPALEIEWRTEDPVRLEGPFLGGELAGSALSPRAPLFVSVSSSGSYGYGTVLARMPADGGALETSSVIDMNFARTAAIDVVDYDNDGTDEAFLASHNLYNGLLRTYDFFADTSDWSAPELSNVSLADVTHEDLTGDGRADLIAITTSGVVYAHDVYHQTLIWQSTTLANGGRRVLTANMDGDANDEPEIVVVTPGYVYVYRRNASPGVPYLQMANPYQSNRDILDATVGDTDGDGELEVVLLVGQSYSSSYPTDIIRLDESLQPIGSFTLPWSALTVDIEPSSTARKNLIVGRIVGTSYSYDGAIAIVGARSGGVVFESPTLIGSVQRKSVHYVTLPGETRPRVSIGTANGMYLTR